MKVFENYAKNKQKPKISFSLFSTSKKFFKSYFLLMKTLKKINDFLAYNYHHRIFS